ncbi:MAG: hypothetical protein COU69_00765 [Candidatus Pacebacteria bacterium CG10_big_fil_rev_8_21_14_0_10_56_10]|nr:MAG: hypothetical protein COU69_00765 [Candidatus Pacebacteria bacterium CG10_big_fil_rev_8_21_14_0_10_56_10]
MTTIDIIYQDDDLLVINKPAGMVVNRAELAPSPTVQDWAEERLGLVAVDRTNRRADRTTQITPTSQFSPPPPNHPDITLPPEFDPQYGTPEEIFRQRGGLVHRLDKDTSGALVIAKHPTALAQLLADFKQRRVIKTYTCLVHGRLSTSQEVISLPIGRSSVDPTKFTVRPDGRPAVTAYRLERYLTGLDPTALAAALPDQAVRTLTAQARSYQGFSLVTCWPKTGRTHQVRVHLAHRGHPLVGDKTYAGKKRRRLDKLWCPRQFLHASRIELPHPRGRQPLVVQVQLADDLEHSLKLLRS